jgi:glucose/arabinose dehydrogenase
VIRKGPRLRVCWVANVALLTVAPSAWAAVELTRVVQGLDRPVYVTHAGDGSHRRFIVEQAGRIRVQQPGATALTTFLDLTSRVRVSEERDDERGLLGLAFHPQFRTNGRFFVNYTREPDGATVVAEYRVSRGNVNVADPVERVLLTVAQPFPNHNGGMLDFGPDGFLYIALGDGGGPFDPDNRAQNPQDLLGKILRIDVDQAAGPAQPYSSPPTNPFAGAHPGRDEIFALGFRNPWRFSFDRATGELYVGDVGQAVSEEIDVVVAGGNYGWRIFEGTRCTGESPGECGVAGFIPPLVEYGHTGDRCSVTGGYVYRAGASSLPAGGYVFGDYCTGEIFLLLNGTPTALIDTDLLVSSFGVDEAGEIYVVDHGGGAVYWVTNPTFLKLGFNQKVFRPGDTAVVSATLANRDAQAVDVFFGVIPPPELGPALGCPVGDAVVLLIDGFAGTRAACFSTFPHNFQPVAQDLPLTGALPLTELPSVFRFTWPQELPPGAYTFFMAFTRPGALMDGHVGPDDLLALASESVIFDR